MLVVDDALLLRVLGGVAHAAVMAELERGELFTTGVWSHRLMEPRHRYLIAPAVHHQAMEQDRRQALLALSLVEGMLRSDAVAESLAIDTFEGIEDAARAHAHLSGFLLEVLASERGQTVDVTARHVRSLLER